MTMQPGGPWIVGEGFPDTVATVFEAGDTIINQQGLFVYSGAPGPGNLIFSVASAAGTDQFGNNYGAGVNAGNQAGAHLAISAAGDMLIANAADEPVLFIYHGDGSVRLYNPAGIAAGNLVTVISPAAGSDSAGNPYGAGFTSATPGSYQININSGYIFFGSQNPLTTIAEPGDVTITDSEAASSPPGLSVAAPSGVTGQTAQLQLFGQSEDGTSGPQASLLVETGSSASSLNLFPSGGVLQAFIENSLDGNNYDLGRKTVYTTGTQTIGSTTQATVTGLSVPVAPGKYRFHATLLFKGLAANTAYLTMGGSCTASAFNAMIFYGDANNFTRQQTTLGSNTGLGSYTLSATGTYICYIDGNITVSAAGTLTVNAAASANANTFQTQAGCLLEIHPDN